MGMDIEQLVLETLLSANWAFSFSEDSIILDAPAYQDARKVLYTPGVTKTFATWAIRFDKLATLIRYPGCRKGYRIPQRMAYTDAGEQMSNLQINPSRDTDLALEAYSSEFPVWITRMTDQKVLLCNQLAIDTQQKDPAELLGESIVPLWDNDPLETMIQYLQCDQTLTNYENPGYRWVKEDNSPIWKRTRFIFVTDYRITTFLGQPCRISFTKSAEPV